MIDSRCPELERVQAEIVAIRAELEVWRDQADPDLGAEADATGLWGGRVRDLEAGEQELLGYARFLEAEFYPWRRRSRIA